MSGMISIVISQSALEYILNQETNKDKLFIILAETERKEEHKALEDELGKLEKKYRDRDVFVVLRIFTKTSPEFIEEYQIKNDPTVLFLKDKIKVNEYVGLKGDTLEDIAKTYITKS